jgi:hypothetical protein
MVTRSGPVAEFPTQINVGERAVGESVTSSFVIANRGASVLTIDNVRTNCSCSGLERLIDGMPAPVRSLTLAPGEGVGLQVRVVVRGTPGRAVHNMIEFRTNDTALPTGVIKIVVPSVIGGVTTYPPELLFGNIPVGKVCRQVVDVYDTAATQRSIERAVSSDPERVVVKVLPPNASHPVQANSSRIGKLIGRLEIAVQTDLPGAINSSVFVYTSGLVEPDRLQVSGRVSLPVDVLPSALTLPRLSDTGLIYSARCLCRSVEGRPIRVNIDPTPVGLTAEIERSDLAANSCMIKVTWDPKIGEELADDASVKLRIRASIEGVANEVIEVPVKCHRMR